MKILIDTCIIIDALQSREPFFHDAQTLFLYAANRKFDGFITAKATTDIYYLMHRYTHSEKDTRIVLNKLFRLFDLVDSAGADCKFAIRSETSDYEDAVMIETALRSGMDGIVTRNLKDYSKSAVPVFSPEELLKRLQEMTSL